MLGITNTFHGLMCLVRSAEIPAWSLALFSLSFGLLLLKAGCAVWSATLLANLIDFGLVAANMNAAIQYGIESAFTSLVSALSGSIASYCFCYLGETLINSIKNRLLYAATTQHTRSLSDGYLSARVAEADNLLVLFSPSLFQQIGSIAQSVFACGALALTYPDFLSFVALASALFIPAFIALTIKMGTLQSELMESRAHYSSVLLERLSGRFDFFYRLHFSQLLEKLTCAGNETRRSSSRWTGLGALLSESASSFTTLLNILVLLLVASNIFQHEATLGQTMQIAQYSLMAVSPFLSISTTLLLIRPAITSADRLQDFFTESIKDDPAHRTVICDGQLSSIVSLEISGLEVATSEEKAETIPINIEFTACSPELISLSGANGSGKTTFVEALAGIGAIVKGDIRINGENIPSTCPKVIPQRLSIMQQNSNLYDDTIMNNITFGDRSNSLRYTLLYNHLGLSGIERRLASQGKDSIGVNGGLLSGGERQRIALARTLYRDADIYIFDEPSAGLDAKALEQAKQLIVQLSSRSIVLVIDHTGFLNHRATKCLRLS